MPRVRFKRWFEKCWKISNVAHPRNNLFGKPKATKPCGNCLQSLTKLCTTSLLVLSHRSLRPTLFTSVHFLFLPFSLFLGWVNNTRSFHCRMLLNSKYKPSISPPLISSTPSTLLSYQCHRTYIYNIWKKFFICVFSISSSALIDSSSLIWSTSRKKPESEGNYRVSGIYPILFYTIFYLVSL